ncbi:MAG TPA: hypothetical protein VLH40_05250 [Atribacteraceae bacterium]|nr:hypothetical protein [Atribacteraceae bacterium]
MVKHQGTANPIAEFCVEEEINFKWRENDDGILSVMVTLAFEAEGKETVIRFPVVPLVER